MFLGVWASSGCGGEFAEATQVEAPPIVSASAYAGTGTVAPADAGTHAVDAAGQAGQRTACETQRQQVAAVIDDWAAAQAGADPQAYFATYDPSEFAGIQRMANGGERTFDLAGWRRARGPMFQHDQNVEVAELRVVTDCDAAVPEHDAHAMFVQRWASRGHADHGVKYMRLRRAAAGGPYRITYEQMVTSGRGWDETPKRIGRNASALSTIRTWIARHAAVSKTAGRAWQPDWDAVAVSAELEGSSTLYRGRDDFARVELRYGSEHSGEIWNYYLDGERLRYVVHEEWSWQFDDTDACAAGRAGCTRDTSEIERFFLDDGRLIRVELPRRDDEYRQRRYDELTGDMLELCAHWWKVFTTNHWVFSEAAQRSIDCIPE